MNAFYLILGSESALADRALTKLNAQLKDEKCEITTLFAADTIVGDIADALAPSLFSERRALIIRDLQDLPEDNRDEITRYLDQPDASTTVIFVHKGGVKGKALLDAIKKVKPEVIACDPLKKEAEKEEFVKTLFLVINSLIISAKKLFKLMYHFLYFIKIYFTNCHHNKTSKYCKFIIS